ncbi:hypothetical protein BGX30_010357 [Mortierella sp. GBA39]|nr:hypothetical protein BGX30_010357 [Mortierella sp. GBA39]
MSHRQDQEPSTPRTNSLAPQGNSNEQKPRYKKFHPNNANGEVTYSHNYQRLMRLGRKRTLEFTFSDLQRIFLCDTIIKPVKKPLPLVTYGCEPMVIGYECRHGDPGSGRSNPDSRRSKFSASYRSALTSVKCVLPYIGNPNTTRTRRIAGHWCQCFVDIRTKHPARSQNQHASPRIVLGYIGSLISLGSDKLADLQTNLSLQSLTSVDGLPHTTGVTSAAPTPSRRVPTKLRFDLPGPGRRNMRSIRDGDTGPRLTATEIQKLLVIPNALVAQTDYGKSKPGVRIVPPRPFVERHRNGEQVEDAKPKLTVTELQKQFVIPKGVVTQKQYGKKAQGRTTKYGT